MYEPRASYGQSNQLEMVDLTFIHGQLVSVTTQPYLTFIGYLKTRGEKVMAHSSHINISENTYMYILFSPFTKQIAMWK